MYFKNTNQRQALCMNPMKIEFVKVCTLFLGYLILIQSDQDLLEK